MDLFTCFCGGRCFKIPPTRVFDQPTILCNMCVAGNGQCPVPTLTGVGHRHRACHRTEALLPLVQHSMVGWWWMMTGYSPATLVAWKISRIFVANWMNWPIKTDAQMSACFWAQPGETWWVFQRVGVLGLADGLMVSGSTATTTEPWTMDRSTHEKNSQLH